MKKVIIGLLFLIALQPLCFAGKKLQSDEARFDLRAATLPEPPPGVCKTKNMYLGYSFKITSKDGYNINVEKGISGNLNVELQGSDERDYYCTPKEKRVTVYVDGDCVSITPESVFSDNNGDAKFNFIAKKEGQASVEFACDNIILSKNFTVVSKSTKYEVYIYKKSDSVFLKDVWSFSENGNFQSKKLGLSGTWKSLGNDSFSVKIDQKKIKNSLNAALLKVGLDAEDSNMTVKKMRILGVFQNDGIKGNLPADLKLNITSPINTSITTKAKLSFTGELSD